MTERVFIRINGKILYLWRAVDDEGEVLDVLVQSRRNKRAALKLMKRLLKSHWSCHGLVPVSFEQYLLWRRQLMSRKYTDEFRRDAVRIATTSGLTRPQVSSDLGVGLSTLNKWVQKHQHDDLMSGPHEDVEKENSRLRKEVRLLREEREVLKKAAIFFAGQSPLSRM
jgi:transposase